MARLSRWSAWKVVVAAAALATGVLGDNILKTSGFTSCADNSTIKVDKVDLSYNNSNKSIVFDVRGSASKEQNVKAVLEVMAYGNSIYSNEFNPCDKDTFIDRLCPVPAGDFSAKGKLQIPEEQAGLVPDIAFQIPDIAAQATLKLMAVDGGEEVACIQSHVTNGKTASLPAVSYVAAGIAGVALVLSGVSAVSAVAAGGSIGGTGTTTPGFSEMMGWFQGMAMNGMMSVNYPPVYRSFTKNFAFSTGIIPWTQLQETIDDFRGRTGGNLTTDSVAFLKNATLVFSDGSTVEPKGMKVKRAFDALAIILARQIEASVGDETKNEDSTEGAAGVKQVVSGIQAYVEQLAVPKSNVFMTILLVVAIVIATIIVGLLLVKVVLELWALWGSFPEGLRGFRKHYWGTIARTITSLILVLYGVWVLYCVFQFTKGDSWAAKALAGVTLGIFTAILIFFSWKIWSTARKLKTADGDINALYEDKSLWIKYSLFYDAYRKNYWWLFVPTILYMFVKGVVLAVGDGNGMSQTITMLVIEGLMFCMLLWSRPYERRSGNVINIIIQAVRVLSVACILVFVEEFGIRQTTQTVTGVVLIVVQSTLTGVLAILLVWNAINACCKENPHRKRRKEMEKHQRDIDVLTPLDARNSLLLDRPGSNNEKSMLSMANVTRDKSPSFAVRDPYSVEDGLRPTMAPSGGPMYRPLTPTTPSENQSLVRGAAPIGGSQRSLSPNYGQQTLLSPGYGQQSLSPGYGQGYGQGYGYGNGYRGY